MLKSIQNLGNLLTKSEQQKIQGGNTIDDSCIECTRQCRYNDPQHSVEYRRCVERCFIEVCEF
ncbi:hypothetical protein [Aquimarina rhabdastrellae]